MTHKQHGREFVGTVALKRGPNLGHARECSALLSDRAKNFAYILAKLFAKRRTSANDGQHIKHTLAINRARVAHVFKPFWTMIGTHTRRQADLTDKCSKAQLNHA
jgi:hypothetical protein